MLPLVVPAVMKKKPVPKNVSFLTATNSGNGTPKTSGLNYGTCLTAKNTQANISGYSR
jgi:hypothetical protein